MGRRAAAPAQQISLGFDAGEGVVQAPHLQSWAPQFWPLAAGWAPLVSSFLSAPEGQRLGQFITERLQTGAVIYPPQPFRALALTPLTEVKVLILGQDPYHGPAQAQGLAFSVSPGTRMPPSLRNILKERARDLGPSVGPSPVDSLESWARQGVLLLNTCLSVEQGRPASHANQGWEVLTHSIVQALADSAQPRVFMLWGAHAQAFAGLISARHLVLTANHPSPLSASRPPQPFIGCGHFSAANAWLLDHQEKAIVW